jgi:hypothetical protein
MGHAVAMLGQEQTHRKETKVSGIKLEMVPARMALPAVFRRVARNI